ncbi:unnamed protein product [Vitrella brassicaformis CCMP3155]|uniref:Amine oxidase domain-containing protein n=2 Tax=Vitrella brassicaformis TaxID=1169539 RepID=A0A0G4EFC2_VITBC|nr:unnamed protein product [Vitrella brassicaformis CCMP3155]|eukprot:CEL94447.1 unnamed protein product [Vitrella brassicaformis CCMP3155]
MRSSPSAARGDFQMKIQDSSAAYASVDAVDRDDDEPRPPTPDTPLERQCPSWLDWRVHLAALPILFVGLLLLVNRYLYSPSAPCDAPSSHPSLFVRPDEALPYSRASLLAALGYEEDCSYPHRPTYCPRKTADLPSSDLADTDGCRVAIVGAGIGGAYVAWRLLKEGNYTGRDICMFEMTSRLGGRIMSLRGLGQYRDLVVEPGAYRIWPAHTPTMWALKETLRLNVSCYNPLDCQRYKLVDSDGANAGLIVMVETLVNKTVPLGIRTFPRHKLTRLNVSSEEEGPITLSFANDVHVRADRVVLNVPVRPLLEVLRESDLPATMMTVERWKALHTLEGETVTKLYLYYSDAWWQTKLHLVGGDFSQEGDSQHMLLKGRYHDGHIRCRGGSNATEECYGFLLAVYEHDEAGETARFFRRFQRERGAPYTIIDHDTPEGQLFLDHAHRRVVDFHREGLQNKSLSLYKQTLSLKPSFAVLSSWYPDTRGHGAGWHRWGAAECHSRSCCSCEAPLADLAADPFASAGVPIYLVNEAYSDVQGWAEGSLQMADRVLERYFGLAYPWGHRPWEDRSEDLTTPAPEVGDGGGSGDVLLDSGGQL